MYRLFLAWRFLLSRPIHLLGMLGVTVSVWALIVVVSIFSGFIREVRYHIRAATSDLTVLRLHWGANYAEIEPVLMADPNVAAAAPRLVWYGLVHALGKTAEVLPQVETIQAAGADSAFVMLIGIDPDRERKVTGFADWLQDLPDQWRVPNRLEPFAATNTLGEPGILLSQDRLKREFVDRGRAVRVTTARLQSGGEQALAFHDTRFEITGGFSTQHVAFDAVSTFVPIQALGQLLAPDRQALTNEIVIKLRDTNSAIATAERLQVRLRQAFPLHAGDASVLTWEQRNQSLLMAVDHQRSLMKLVLFVIMVVAAFLMYATLSMMVAEKTGDIGILTALGASRGGVALVFLTCGLTITIVGAGLGVLLGCISAIELDSFNNWLNANFGVDLFPKSIYNLKRVPHHLDPIWILQVFGMALAVGTVVSVLPAWSAARHDPLQSLRAQ